MKHLLWALGTGIALLGNAALSPQVSGTTASYDCGGPGVRSGADYAVGKLHEIVGVEIFKRSKFRSVNEGFDILAG